LKIKAVYLRVLEMNKLKKIIISIIKSVLVLLIFGYAWESHTDKKIEKQLSAKRDSTLNTIVRELVISREQQAEENIKFITKLNQLDSNQHIQNTTMIEVQSELHVAVAKLVVVQEEFGKQVNQRFEDIEKGIYKPWELNKDEGNVNSHIFNTLTLYNEYNKRLD
jgi:hypothetical protein